MSQCVVPTSQGRVLLVKLEMDFCSSSVTLTPPRSWVVLRMLPVLLGEAGQCREFSFNFALLMYMKHHVS